MKLLITFFCVFIFFSSCGSTATTPQREDMVADADPMQIGKATIFFERMFSMQLVSREVPLTFDPRSNTIYLQFVYETVTYRQFWDKEAREKFINAQIKYKENFESRNLNLSNPKARRVYGSANGKTEWGQFSFSINARSFPRFDLGYQTKGNNPYPYFTVMQQEARDVLANDGRSSLRITSYFTRDQVTDLAKFFSQEYLIEFLQTEGIKLYSEQAVDEY